MDAIKKLYERWTRADEDLSLSDNLQLKAQCKNAMACIEEVAGCQKLVALDVSDYERFLSQGGMPKSVIIEISYKQLPAASSISIFIEEQLASLCDIRTCGQAILYMGVPEGVDLRIDTMMAITKPIMQQVSILKWGFGILHGKMSPYI